MTKQEYERKLAEVDRLLNDPEASWGSSRGVVVAGRHGTEAYPRIELGFGSQRRASVAPAPRWNMPPCVKFGHLDDQHATPAHDQRIIHPDCADDGGIWQNACWDANINNCSPDCANMAGGSGLWARPTPIVASWATASYVSGPSALTQVALAAGKQLCGASRDT